MAEEPGSPDSADLSPRPRHGFTFRQQDGTQARPGARARLKGTAGSVLKGAASGAVKGGGVQGAVVGASKALLKTPAGRRLVAALVVLAVAIPIGGLVLMVNLMGAVVPSEEEGRVQENSQQTVLDSSGIAEADLAVMTDVAGAGGVPWQILAALTSGGSTSGSGGVAEVIVPDDMTCPDSGLAAESGLTADALLVLRCGAHQFPQITSWGGLGERTNNPNSDHPAGRAVDAMIPGWDTPEGNTFGWEVAHWYQANAEALGIRYVLFDSQQWTAGDDDWSAYSHPSGASNPTLNHEDHVHVSVLADGQTAPDGSGGSGAGSGSGGGAGWGPFRVSPDAGLSQEQAQDLATASSWVAAQLSASMSSVPQQLRSLGTGVAVLDDGSLTVAVSADAATGADGQYVDNDLADAAARTEAAWTAAIGDLDVVGMSQSRASQVFTTARNWYLGVASGGGSVCVPSADGTSVTELESQDAAGTPVLLNADQLQVASLIIGAAESAGVGQPGAVVGLMTALQESTLRNLANDGSDPRLSAEDRAVVMESLNYPNQGIGSDWDSVNPFQQRPSQGWGTVEELMDPTYAATTFFERLVQVDGWEGMEPTQAAQTVQRSKYPDAYAKWEPVAQDIVAQVGGASCSGTTPVFSAEGWTYPLPEAGKITSTYGPRVLFGNTMHNGTDLAVPAGTPILAVQDGVVVAARGCYKGCVDKDFGLSGWMIAIDHGGGVVTAYTHMATDSPLQEGDTVTAGQEIGQVGLSGNTTGPHLHFSVFVDGSSTDPQPFMEGVGITLGQLP